MRLIFWLTMAVSAVALLFIHNPVVIPIALAAATGGVLTYNLSKERS